MIVVVEVVAGQTRTWKSVCTFLTSLFLVCRERTKNIDVTEISRDIYSAEDAQDKANDDLERASLDENMIRDRVQDVNRILQISVI